MVLKNTNPKLVLTWFKFSKSSSDFDFQSNDVLDYWNNFDNYTYSEEGLTFRSIIYWSKISNFEEYNNIHKKTIDYYIFVSFKSNTECDLATTMYHMYKSQFVCTSIKDNMWYQFINHRWCRIDSGTTLRTKIHTEVYNQYTSKVLKYQTDMNATQNNMSVVNNNVKKNTIQDDSEFTDFKKQLNNMFKTCLLLKKLLQKNIMKECKDLFYDEHFQNKLDKNPYILGYKNCVIDFKIKHIVLVNMMIMYLKIQI